MNHRSVLLFYEHLLNIWLILSCQYSDPLEAVDFDYRHEAFEYLIRLEQGEGDRGRELEIKRRERGEREHDAPHEDNIVEKDEIRISAARDYTGETRHFIRCAYRRDAENEHEYICELRRLNRGVIDRDYRLSD